MSNPSAISSGLLKKYQAEVPPGEQADFLIGGCHITFVPVLPPIHALGRPPSKTRVLLDCLYSRIPWFAHSID